MDTLPNPNYKKGFIPFAIAAAALSLAGGFTSGVPAAAVADWGVDYGNTAWISLTYAMGAAACAPILGKLCDVFGRRATILIGLIIFGIGEVLTGISGSMTMILVSRFVCGVGAAAIAPVIMAYITTEFPPTEIGKGFSIYMLISCASVVVGPTVGGLIMQFAGWRVVLYAVAAMVAVAFFVCFATIKKTAVEKKSMAGFDFVGAVFVLIFFSIALSLPTFGQNMGWTSKITLIAFGTAALSLILLVIFEKKAKQPILNGKFMARKAFILPVLILLLTNGLVQGSMTNVILFVRMTQPDNVLISGYAVSILYVGMAIGSIVIGPMADKKEPRYVAACALVLAAIGTAMQFMYTESTSFVVFALALGILGVGLGGNGSIFMKVALSGLTPAEAGGGSGTYGVFRDVATPLGVAVFVPMFTSGVGTAAAKLAANGTDQSMLQALGAVASIKNVAAVELVCIAVGIVICLMLPKVFAKQKA